MRPLRDWPGIRENHWEIVTKTDPMLSLLPNVYNLLSDAHHERDSISDPSDVRNGLAALEAFEPPRLVVALEYDHWAPESKDWRGMGFSRGMQFVQVSTVAINVLASYVLLVILPFLFISGR